MPCKNCDCVEKLKGGSPASRLVMGFVKKTNTCNKVPRLPRSNNADSPLYDISSGGARKTKRRSTKRKIRRRTKKTRVSRRKRR